MILPPRPRPLVRQAPRPLISRATADACNIAGHSPSSLKCSSVTNLIAPLACVYRGLLDTTFICDNCSANYRASSIGGSLICLEARCSGQASAAYASVCHVNTGPEYCQNTFRERRHRSHEAASSLLGMQPHSPRPSKHSRSQSCRLWSISSLRHIRRMTRRRKNYYTSLRSCTLKLQGEDPTRQGRSMFLPERC